jgi:hypothetical protein
MAAAQALFYSRTDLSRSQLVQLVAGVFPNAADLDRIEFGEEEGGTADRELAIPFLADMDEVVVDAAELRLAARELQQDVTGYSVTAISSGDDQGVVLALDTPARLAKVVLDAPDAPPPTAHLVVRSAQPRQGGGFSFGPPIFAHPPFALPSKLYDPVLGGLTVTPVSGKGLQVAFPATPGSGWLFQYATGNDPTTLTPIPFASSVRRVVIEAAPRGLTVLVAGRDGAPDTVLWSYANALLPDVGTQVVSFTPVAQKRLAAALAAVGAGAADVTLPVPLRFSSSSGGLVGIEARTLQAHYVVHPLGPAPTTVSLAGGWTPLDLSAPGLRPSGGELRIVAKHRGHVLNDGSPVPPVAAPSAGVRVDSGRWAAVAASFAPAAGAAPGSPLPLVAVRVPLEVTAPAEAALELRADAAGTPGAVLAPPVVRRLQPGGDPWVTFEPAEPLPLPAGTVPVWVSLRTTKGEVRWFAGPPGNARISADSGATWGEVDALLLPTAAPLVQLFHAVPDPPPAPAVQLQLGEESLGEIAFGEPHGRDPREFATATTDVPQPVLDALARGSGPGRVTTRVLVFSRAVVDLVVSTWSLDYDPAGAS